jgi:hypothetical protein
VLKKIFGRKRKEAAGEDCINCTLPKYYKGDQINKDKMGLVCSTMRNAHKILVAKPEGKTASGRRRHRCEDNTGMNLRAAG